MFDFSNVASVMIPEGNVKKITGADGAVLWEKRHGELTWEAVLASIAAGTYATDYAVGDCIPLDLGSKGTVNMQIAGFDVDTKADGTSTAPITWISKEVSILHKMNAKLVTNDDGTYEVGTGSIGGWEQSDMRSYLISTIYPLIPKPVSSAIVPVTKTQTAYDTAGSSFTQTTTDDVWIPSYRECFGLNSTYYGLFRNENENRIKKSGETTISSWWLRTTNGTNGEGLFHAVGTTGTAFAFRGTDYALGVAIGFCT